MRSARSDPPSAPSHAAQDLDEGAVRRSRAERPAVTLEPGDLRAGPLPRFRQQACLANPRFPDQQHDLALPAGEPVQGGVQAAQLRRAPNQRPRVGDLGDRRRADEPPGAHRFGPALDLNLPEGFGQELPAQAARSLLTDHDRPGSGPGLEPGGDVGGVAEGHDLRVVGTDQADPGPAAVDPDPHAELGNAPRRFDLAAVGAHQLDDAQARPRRPLRVVLVGGRHAEVGTDPIALVGLHRAAVLLDGATHPRHALADEGLHLVRGQPLAQPGRAGDVGEEGGDGAQLVGVTRHSADASDLRWPPEPPRGWTDTSRGRCSRR